MKLQLAMKGKSAFPEFPYAFKKQIEEKETTCSENIIDCRGFLPSGSDSSLVSAREEPIPMLNYGVFTDQTVGFPVSLFLLTFLLFFLPSISPSLLRMYVHIIFLTL